MLEEAEMLPGALHGVVDGAELGGVGIREAAAGLEVDDEFEGSCGGIESGGDDLPRGGKSERLGEEMIGGHGAEPATKTGELPTRTRRSDEFRIPFSQRNLVDNSPRLGAQIWALPTRNSDVPLSLNPIGLETIKMAAAMDVSNVPDGRTYPSENSQN